MEKVFDKSWFAKHQRILVWLANSKLGNFIFGFKKLGHYLEHKIVKITPNSVAELLEVRKDEVELKEHFFIRNNYAQRLYFYLLPLWWIIHIWDFFADFAIPQLSFGFSTLTANPAVGANSPCDGVTYRSMAAPGEVWATLIAGAGTFASVTGDSTTICFYLVSTSTNLQWQMVSRMFFNFDTSSLGSGATISAAVMSMFGSSKSDSLTVTPNIDVYTATPAATNTLAITDFQNVGSVSQTGTPITYAGWSTTAYNDFTFNATGIGNVSKTGISKFCLRNASYDVATVAPAWVSNGVSELKGRYADDLTNVPKLVITYTVAVSNSNFLSFFS